MSNNIRIINGFSLVSISILGIIRIIIVIGIIIYNVLYRFILFRLGIIIIIYDT